MGKNYIDNKKFESLIQSYIKDKSNKDIEEELFAMMELLVSNIFSSFNFSIDEDDAKQDSMFLIIKILKNFDKESGTAFNYFTTVILNNFKLLYTKDKKYTERLEEYGNHLKETTDSIYFSSDTYYDMDDYDS